MQRKKFSSVGFDLRSPLEKVLEILNDVRDKLNVEEEILIKDINYCIKVISSNKLYEAELDFEDQTDGKKKSEVLNWY